jgi:hypothetical protein
MECPPNYLSYSLGLMNTKARNPTCANLTEGYIHELTRAQNIELIGGRATKLSIGLAPCEEKCIYLDKVGISQLVCILVKVECGKVIYSTQPDYWLPLNVLFLDLGVRQCETQVINTSIATLDNLWLKSLLKEDFSEVSIVLVGY